MNFTKDQKVIIQGITGKEAIFWAEKMVKYGTNIIAGTSPGKAGKRIHNIEVFNTVKEAVEKYKIDTSILFIPPLYAKFAAFEAIEAGIKQLIILSDGVPVHDTIDIISIADIYKVTVFGPNTPGIVIPGNSSLGIMPCWLEHVFKPGSVAVLSRSGSLGNEICYQVSQSGLGISKFIGIGGDALVGTTFDELLIEMESDEEVEAIVLIGELGGNMEEMAAKRIPDITKPIFAFIAGKTAPVGIPMGHAGALVEDSAGNADSKIRILREKGVYVVDTPEELPKLLEIKLRSRVN